MLNYVCAKFDLNEIEHKKLLSTKQYCIEVTNENFWQLLQSLYSINKKTVTEEALVVLCEQAKIDVGFAKKQLKDKLNLLQSRPLGSIEHILLDVDDPFMHETLQTDLSEFINIIPFKQASEGYGSPEIFVYTYRSEYDDPHLENVLKKIHPEQYITTSGIVQKSLQIDNIFSLCSGLPSHHSNLSRLRQVVNSGISLGRDNWMLHYRKMCQLKVDRLPVLELNKSEKSYVTYLIYSHLRKMFNPFEKKAMRYDDLKLFQSIDLDTGISMNEVAIHAPDDISINVQIEEYAHYE